MIEWNQFDNCFRQHAFLVFETRWVLKWSSPHFSHAPRHRPLYKRLWSSVFFPLINWLGSLNQPCDPMCDSIQVTFYFLFLSRWLGSLNRLSVTTCKSYSAYVTGTQILCSIQDVLYACTLSIARWTATCGHRTIWCTVEDRASMLPSL